jgi:hypothetical protein
VLRFLLWRLLGLLALVAGFALVGWLLEGGPGRLLRGEPTVGAGRSLTRLPGFAVAIALSAWRWSPGGGLRPLAIVAAASAGLLACLIVVRLIVRHRRRYVRLRIEAHRTDQARAESIVRLFDVVQFLDSPAGEAGEPSGVEAPDDRESRELVGVGADELDVTF